MKRPLCMFVRVNFLSEYWKSIFSPRGISAVDWKCICSQFRFTSLFLIRFAFTSTHHIASIYYLHTFQTQFYWKLQAINASSHIFGFSHTLYSALSFPRCLALLFIAIFSILFVSSINRNGKQICTKNWLKNWDILHLYACIASYTNCATFAVQFFVDRCYGKIFVISLHKTCSHNKLDSIFRYIHCIHVMHRMWCHFRCI